MIIQFQGTMNSNNNVETMTVLTAALESFRSSKKVCLISFRDHIAGKDMEDYAIPNDMSTDSSDNATSAIFDQFSFADNGIDAVFRRAETGKITPESFDNCVTPLVKTKNALDLLKTTKEARFEDDLSQRWDTVNEIIQCASSIYDFVFICIGTKNADFIKKINSVSDKIIVVTHQGRKERLAPDTENNHTDKSAILIQDYEGESQWSIRRLKKQYNTSRLFIAPHFTGFKDSLEDGDVVRFAMRNYVPDKRSSSYPFMKELSHLLDDIDGKSMKEYHLADDITYTKLVATEEAPVLDEFIAPVERESIKVKLGGLFGKHRSAIRGLFRKKDASKENCDFDPALSSEEVSTTNDAFSNELDITYNECAIQDEGIPNNFSENNTEKEEPDFNDAASDPSIQNDNRNPSEGLQFDPNGKWAFLNDVNNPTDDGLSEYAVTSSENKDEDSKEIAPKPKKTRKKELPSAVGKTKSVKSVTDKAKKAEKKETVSAKKAPKKKDEENKKVSKFTPNKVTPKLVSKMCLMHSNGVSVKEISETCGVSKATVYSYLKKEEIAEKESRSHRKGA